MVLRWLWVEARESPHKLHEQESDQPVGHDQTRRRVLLS